MKILFVLYTMNRSGILSKCLETLFNNNKTRPTELLIVDDGSEPELKQQLFNFAAENNKHFPIHFLSFGSNQGLGYQWELVWNWVKARDFDYVFQIEQDYVWRKGGIDEAIEVLTNKPLTCALSGYSNPDFYNGKQNHLFNEVMVDHFGSDPAKREFLHKPFEIDSSFGKIEIQLTTNSCGTFLCNWRRVKELLDKYPEMWEKCFERSFNKPYPDRRKAAGDGPITSGFSFYWYKDIEERIKNGEIIDYNVEAPWLDICDYSIGEHLNGGPSINGHIVPEGYTFVGSPKFKMEYLEKNPRI